MAELEPDSDSISDVAVTQVSDEDGVVTFRVSGQLDVSSENVLREALQRAIKRGPTKIVLDVSELKFMDSSGLAVLLVAAREVPTLELHNPTNIIRRLITIAGLAESLPMRPDAPVRPDA